MAEAKKVEDKRLATLKRVRSAFDDVISTLESDTGSSSYYVVFGKLAREAPSIEKHSDFEQLIDSLNEKRELLTKDKTHTYFLYVFEGRRMPIECGRTWILDTGSSTHRIGDGDDKVSGIIENVDYDRIVVGDSEAATDEAE